MNRVETDRASDRWNRFRLLVLDETEETGSVAGGPRPCQSGRGPQSSANSRKCSPYTEVPDGSRTEPSWIPLFCHYKETACDSEHSGGGGHGAK